VNSFIDALIFKKLEKYGHHISYSKCPNHKIHNSLDLYECKICGNLFGIKRGSNKIFLIENEVIRKYGEAEEEIFCDNLIVKNIIQ